MCERENVCGQDMASKSLLACFFLLLLAFLSLLFVTGLLDSRYSPIAPLHYSRRHLGNGFSSNTSGPNPLTKSGETGNFYEIPQSVDEVNGSIALKSTPEVLLLTPLKQAAGHLEQYFRLIHAFSYPSSKISLGFLVSDSKDGTYDMVKRHFQSATNTNRKYNRITLIRQDFHYDPGNSWADIHSLRAQRDRRTILAKSRNYLLMSTIRPEHEWVLWIDSDVSSYPSTLIEDLIGFTGPHHDIIAPNNFWKSNDGQERPYDRNNWQETPESQKFLKETKEDVVFEGYSSYRTGRLILGDLRGVSENIVKLDGVGGTVLLVRARLHREGLIFLPVPFEKTIETEALAKLALAMGYQPWGLPNYITFH